MLSLIRQVASALTLLRGTRRLGHRLAKNSPRKPTGLELVVVGLVGEEVGLDVEREEVDAPPAARAAALGLPALPQRDLDGRHVVDRVDVLVVDEHVVAVVRRGGGEDVTSGSIDVPHAVDVEQPRLDAVVQLPERRADARADGAEQRG